jgi:hypothetical protein
MTICLSTYRLSAGNTSISRAITSGVRTDVWKAANLDLSDLFPFLNVRFFPFRDVKRCVLDKLQRALKCKEVWVEGSYAFRNPSEDMPGDWNDEQRRILHYQELGKPLNAQTFVHSLKERLITALAQFNRVLPRLRHLRIFHPKNHEERGLWVLAKLEPQSEPRSLGLIKEAIDKRYGILDLLDVFVEVDRIVDLTRFFTHSGMKEVRSREELRPLLMLDLFAEGTNTGSDAWRTPTTSIATTNYCMSVRHTFPRRR